MHNSPQIIITAHCDKAARANNEDSCLVRADLSRSDLMYSGDRSPYLSDLLDLGERGCLLVVADGMGGMNAGEVASRIAVESVSNFFDTQIDNIADQTDDELLHKIEEAVVYADMSIKFDAEQNPGHSGMGTTIAILWLVRGKAYIGWCGDSRIYRFNTGTGRLERLTHDHSLVQVLVDEGDITEAAAFDHPKSNIIMRSLGDSVEKVKPETRKTALPLRNGDVFLLCSDGLHGAIPDKPIEGKFPRNVNLESILSHASEVFAPAQLDKWNDLLWEAAEEHWHDNVTSILCHISHCDTDAESVFNPEPETVKEDQSTLTQTKMSEKSRPTPKALVLIIGLAVVVITLLGVIIGRKMGRSIPTPPTAQTDTAAVQPVPVDEETVVLENTADSADNAIVKRPKTPEGGNASADKDGTLNAKKNDSNETRKDSL